jgi:hypothetical protein
MTDAIRADTGVREEAPAGCRGLNVDGSPCTCPTALVRASGFCFAHDPALEQQRAVARLRGGTALARKHALRRGLDPDELGPLATPEDAQRWAETIGRAVLTNRVTASQASAARGVLSEWRASQQRSEDRDALERIIRLVQASAKDDQLMRELRKLTARRGAA